jgi:hypothetical protein
VREREEKILARGDIGSLKQRRGEREKKKGRGD